MKDQDQQHEYGGIIRVRQTVWEAAKRVAERQHMRPQWIVHSWLARCVAEMEATKENT